MISKLVTLMVASLSFNAFADEAKVCRADEGLGLSRGCAIAGAGGAAALGAGIYSFKKFSGSSDIKAKNTHPVKTFSQPTLIDENLANTIAGNYRTGDVGTIELELSEERSRQIRISEFESRIDSYNRQIGEQENYARQALIPRQETETYTDSNGKVKTRQVMKGPDLNAYNYHMSQAENLELRVKEARRDLRSIQNGGPIQLVRRTEEITDELGSVKKYILSEARMGSKFIGTYKLPAQFAEQASKMGTKGAIGLGVAAVGGAAVVAGGLVESNDFKERDYESRYGARGRR